MLDKERIKRLYEISCLEENPRDRERVLEGLARAIKETEKIKEINFSRTTSPGEKPVDFDSFKRERTDFGFSEISKKEYTVPRGEE